MKRTAVGVIVCVTLLAGGCSSTGEVAPDGFDLPLDDVWDQLLQDVPLADTDGSDIAEEATPDTTDEDADADEPGDLPDEGVQDGELRLAAAAGEQVLPHLASWSGKGVWASWYHGVDDRFEMRLQQLDDAGLPRFGADAILISAHPSESWVMDYGLASDHEGNAVLAFCDTRAGRFTLHAYKVMKNGTFAWGPDGIDLSLGAGEDMTPSLVVTTNNDAVVAWPETDDLMGTSVVRVQRIAPDGTLAWPGGKTLTPGPGVLAVRPQVVPAPQGAVIVVWVEAPDLMSTTRVIRAQKFATNGSALWNSPVVLSNSMDIAFYHTPFVAADADGGAFVAWLALGASDLKGFIQHVDSAGALTMGPEGMNFSTSENTFQIVSGLVFVPETGEAVVSWKETSPSQDDCGLYLQAFTAAGTRRWAGQGLVLVPRTETQVLAAALRALGRSVVVLYGEWVFGTMSDARILAARVPLVTLPEADSTLLCGVQSSKEHATASDPIDDGFWFAWEDRRNDDTDIYGAFWSPSEL